MALAIVTAEVADGEAKQAICEKIPKQNLAISKICARFALKSTTGVTAVVRVLSPAAGRCAWPAKQDRVRLSACS